MAKAAHGNVSDCEARKLGEQTGLDIRLISVKIISRVVLLNTQVVLAVNAAI